MKLLWQDKFDGFDMVRTSPLYYRGAVEREGDALNCYLWNRVLGINFASFDIQNGRILAHGKGEIIKNKTSAPKHNLSVDDFVFGDYTISHYGEWGYMCKKNDRLLWKNP